MCLSKIIEGGQKGRKENIGGCFRTCFRTPGSGCLSFLSSAGFCVLGELFMYILCALIDWFVFELCSCKHSFHSSHRCLTKFQDYFPPWCSARPTVLGFGGFSLICALCDCGSFIIYPRSQCLIQKSRGIVLWFIFLSFLYYTHTNQTIRSTNGKDHSVFIFLSLCYLT